MYWFVLTKTGASSGLFLSLRVMQTASKGGTHRPVHPGERAKVSNKILRCFIFVNPLDDELSNNFEGRNVGRLLLASSNVSGNVPEMFDESISTYSCREAH